MRHPPDGHSSALGAAKSVEWERPSLKLLGGFQLAYRHEPVALPVSSQRVVAILALHSRPLARSYVAGNLWPESLQVQSAANLRSALWRLRRASPWVAEATTTHLSLNDDVVVDARQVIGQARRLLDSRVPCPEADLDPMPLTGELLPDWEADDWVLLERERLRQLCLHGLEALCERLRSIGRYGQAVEAGLAAVRGEPLRESAHRVLIAVHLAEGNHSEALRQYRRYRRLLRDELGIAPSNQITNLVSPLQRAV